MAARGGRDERPARNAGAAAAAAAVGRALQVARGTRRMASGAAAARCTDAAPVAGAVAVHVGGREARGSWSPSAATKRVVSLEHLVGVPARRPRQRSAAAAACGHPSCVSVPVGVVVGRSARRLVARRRPTSCRVAAARTGRMVGAAGSPCDRADSVRAQSPAMAPAAAAATLAPSSRHQPPPRRSAARSPAGSWRRVVRGRAHRPILEDRTRREIRGEAVRLLVRNRARRRSRLGEAAMPIVGLVRASIAIQLERDERTGARSLEWCPAAPPSAPNFTRLRTSPRGHPPQRRRPTLRPCPGRRSCRRRPCRWSSRRSG